MHHNALGSRLHHSTRATRLLRCQRGADMCASTLGVHTPSSFKWTNSQLRHAVRSVAALPVAVMDVQVRPSLPVTKHGACMPDVVMHTPCMDTGLGRAFPAAALCRGVQRSAPVPHLPPVLGAWDGARRCVLDWWLLDHGGACLHTPSRPLRQQRTAALPGAAAQPCVQAGKQHSVHLQDETMLVPHAGAQGDQPSQDQIWSTSATVKSAFPGRVVPASVQVGERVLRGAEDAHCLIVQDGILR